LDELFLTLAPQVAGRDDTGERPGLVAGQRFAPEQPRWGELIGIKRGGSHLFLRYAFASEQITRVSSASLVGSSRRLVSLARLMRERGGWRRFAP
jgi:hypothetical protein